MMSVNEELRLPCIEAEQINILNDKISRKSTELMETSFTIPCTGSKYPRLYLRCGPDIDRAYTQWHKTAT